MPDDENHTFHVIHIKYHKVHSIYILNSIWGSFRQQVLKGLDEGHLSRYKQAVPIGKTQKLLDLSLCP